MKRVACAIIERDGKVLAAQRGEGMSHSGRWEFPGGKVKDGEEPSECVMREVREELDIEISPLYGLEPSIYDYGLGRILLVPFVCRYIGGEIRLLEHMDYRWMGVEELSTIDWCEADIPVIEEYVAQKKR